jgi:hypothetical protein
MQVDLSGNLSGTATVANVQITFQNPSTGAPVMDPSGRFITAVTDANGHFDVVALVPGLGAVVAQTADGSSNQVAATLSVPPPPVIDSFTFTDTYGMYILSGHISQGQLGGMIVTLNNGVDVQNIQVTVDAFGNFQYSARLNMPTNAGTIEAVAQDVWGQTDTAYEILS